QGRGGDGGTGLRDAGRREDGRGAGAAASPDPASRGGTGGTDSRQDDRVAAGGGPGPALMFLPSPRFALFLVLATAGLMVAPLVPQGRLATLTADAVLVLAAAMDAAVLL